MFQFGTTESNAAFYLDLALSQQGLVLPSIPVEEYHTLTGNNLKGALTYLWIAIRAATKADADNEVIELLFGYYDNVFESILKDDESFQSIVCSGIHQPINRLGEKYRKLAGCNT